MFASGRVAFALAHNPWMLQGVRHGDAIFLVDHEEGLLQLAKVDRESLDVSRADEVRVVLLAEHGLGVAKVVRELVVELHMKVKWSITK